MNVLVVAATEVEARYVPNQLPVLLTGIGKVPAATAVASELARSGPGHVDLVLNVGSAGALRDGLQGVYCPSAVVNYEVSADVLAQLGHPVTTCLGLAGGDGTVLATGDAFIASADARGRLSALADLVDMEGFAVAWACEQLHVPCRLVKHVSDRANAEAMAWPDVVDASARALGTWLALMSDVTAARVPTRQY